MPLTKRCDAIGDCTDQSDENDCGASERYFGTLVSVAPPGVIELDGRGGFYKIAGKPKSMSLLL